MTIYLLYLAVLTYSLFANTPKLFVSLQITIYEHFQVF